MLDERRENLLRFYELVLETARLVRHVSVHEGQRTRFPEEFLARSDHVEDAVDSVLVSVQQELALPSSRDEFLEQHDAEASDYRRDRANGLNPRGPVGDR
jgi:hypothetical protein